MASVLSRLLNVVAERFFNDRPVHDTSPAPPPDSDPGTEVVIPVAAPVPVIPPEAMAMVEVPVPVDDEVTPVSPLAGSLEERIARAKKW